MKKNLIIILLVCLIITSCSVNYTKPVPTSSSSTEVKNRKSEEVVVDGLVEIYNEFYEIDQRVQKSEGLGSDVKLFYEDSVLILQQLNDFQVPSTLQEMKKTLYEGIQLRSTAIACFSSKTFCASDAEAVGMLFQGLDKLNKFLDLVDDFDNK